ncbi:MAG TPA: class I SAM-dependent methyltransferase [Acidobacteriota bacterium]|nr:class I SAM-dependent methyltransferase [Acidobacteriota bacterium]
MSEHESGQVPAAAAEIYEQSFIPALFGAWPPEVMAAAEVRAGQDILDVACGTGILAREAKRAVGSEGSVTGVDINDGMLAVARKQSSEISWHKSPAEDLPFQDASFDRVVSQFGLMFFQDKVKAISEMLRVLRPGGRIAVAVWASLGDTPGYAAVVELLTDLFGSDVAKALEAPYSLGDTQALKSLFTEGGATQVSVQTVRGKARFASVEAWIYTDVKGWTLSDAIDDSQYELLKRRAPQHLAPFVLPDGSVEFSSPAHIITAA